MIKRTGQEIVMEKSASLCDEKCLLAQSESIISLKVEQAT